MKKEKVESLYLLILLCLISIFVFASCSTNNPKKTMYDAVNAVLEKEDRSLIFTNGKYLYPDQESLNKVLPTYLLTFMELNGEELSHLTYTVTDEITLVGTSSIEISVEGKTRIEQLDNANILNIIKNQEDSTQMVLEMIEDNEGRRIDEETYTSGLHLMGEHNESWYLIYAVIPDTIMGPIQGAYNSKTGEILVVDQPVSEMAGINMFHLGNRLIVSKNQILDVVYSSEPTSNKWEDVVLLFPESGLSVENTQEISIKIKEGYDADCFDDDADPVHTYSKKEGNIEHNLYFFQDDSWYYTATELN